VIENQQDDKSQLSAGEPARTVDDARPSNFVVGSTVEKAADERYLVPALTRGLEILSILSGERRKLTLSEIAATLGVTRSSAYRLLYTLGHLGFVDYDAGSKSYQLGPQVLNLGFGYLASRDLVEVAMPHLLRLRDRTGWSAHLGELHGNEVVYLARVATRRAIASNVHVGTRLPARATTMGRVLLAGLSEREVRDLYDHEFAMQPRSGGIAQLIDRLADDRARGFVVQNSVYEPGVASVAAPILDANDRTIAAVNISAVAMFTDDTELNGLLKTEVVAAAEAISREIGGRVPEGLSARRT
jgi:DNA-binding IclR family transcriptional regulator